MKRTLVAMVFAVFPVSIFAWDGDVSGYINKVHMQNFETYSARVTLKNSKILCGTRTWAFLHSTDPNYSAIVAGLLSAKATGTSLRIYTNLESPSGDCRIGYVEFN